MAGYAFHTFMHSQLRNLFVFLFIQMNDQLELQPVAEEECGGAETSKMIGDQEQLQDLEETAV
mgnify:CR=1 FL=1